jgi:hypothetical protein
MPLSMVYLAGCLAACLAGLAIAEMWNLSVDPRVGHLADASGVRPHFPDRAGIAKEFGVIGE